MLCISSADNVSQIVILKAINRYILHCNFAVIFPIF